MKPTEITSVMIAACGMNCAICIGHQRKKNICPGCRKDGKGKPYHCVECSIKKCENQNGKYCFSCEKFPCRRLKQLDKRYKAKYRMSMLENLLFVKEKGVNAFVKRERKRWACPKCGNLLSCHRQECVFCGYKVKKGVN
jgi:hypothetical protein